MMDYVTEISSIFGRWIVKTTRRPTILFFTLVQPIIWFFLFTEAFSAVGSIPGFEEITGTDNYKTFFTAAVIVQTVIASALNSGIGMVEDLDSGYLDKLRVAPIRRSSILIGKVLSDGFRIVLQTIVIVVLALIAGVAIITGFLGILMILVFAAAFGIAWSGISTYVALTTKNSESTLVIGLLTTFPLLFLSTAVMPKPLLPDWVQSFSEINPISYVADAVRSLVITGWEWDTIGIGFAVIAVVGVITLTATTYKFRRSVTA
jgi:ABC-2 type transport system permease protein